MRKRTLWIAGLLILVAAATALVLTSRPWSSSENKPKVVAICTLMSHPALDEVKEGIIAELRNRGYVGDESVVFIERNASSQVQMAATIANDLAARNPDVIVAITTPMAQSVAKVARCPVVFAAVTDPVGAGLVESLDTPKPTITGTSDAWPYRDQLRLIREIMPQARKLGVLYNPGEAASQYGIRKIREYAPEFGFEIVEGSVSTTAEVHPVAASLAGRVDAMFLSSDNTVIGGVAGAVRVAVDRKVPLFVGDSGTVKKGGVAAVSVGYRQLGHQTGELVARVLQGERNIPVVVASSSEIYVNTAAAQQMGIQIPEAVIQRATKVYDKVE